MKLLVALLLPAYLSLMVSVAQVQAQEAVKTETQKIKTAADTINTLISKIESDNAELAKKAADLQKSNDEIKAKLASKDADIEATKKVVADLQVKVKALGDEIAKLTKQIMDEYNTLLVEIMNKVLVPMQTLNVNGVAYDSKLHKEYIERIAKLTSMKS